MRLAGPDGPGEDQILRSRDPLATREGVDLGGADTVDGGEVERIERLHFGEARLVEALTDHGFVARGLLGTQHLVQVIFVGPMRVSGLPGQAVERARDAGEFQRARLGDHQLAREGGAHADTPISQPS